MSFPIIRFAVSGPDYCFEPQIPKEVVYSEIRISMEYASPPTLKSAIIGRKRRGRVECVRLHHDQS